MDGKTVRAKLRKVLSELYPDESSARRVMHDAGLKPERINFATGAVNFWQAILSEADKTDKLSELALAAHNDYGDHKELQSILEIYQAARMGESGESVASEELYPSRRGYYVRMGQVSAAVIVLFFIIVLANVQGVSRSLGALMYHKLPSIPTIETMLITVPVETETPSSTHTSTPQPTLTSPVTPWNCEEDVYNCTDFASQNEPQAIYNFCMQSSGQDIHKLDSDKDGLVCEGSSSNSKPALETCEKDFYSCQDFASQNESQAIFDQCMSVLGVDIHKLDLDNDGVACESLSAAAEPAVTTTLMPVAPTPSK